MDLSFSRLLGYARINFTHATSTISLKRKDGSEISLADLCKETTPACKLNPLLFNGHLQTAWTTQDKADIPITYKRKTFESDNTSYAGQFAVDFVVPNSMDPSKVEKDASLPQRTTYYTDQAFGELGSSDSKPMAVVLHGLSGGSHEIYLRYTLAPLVSEEGGWEACVVNSRGCAMSKITSSVLYNARSTWDVRQTVKWLREKFPNRPLFGIGFSLGANILTNYVGEEGSNCVLKAAVVCSNPWNLEAGSLALQRSWIGLEYSKVMGTSMRKLFSLHEEQILKNPKIDREKVIKIKYLHEFDREIQGPTWGYPTEGAYYRDASSTDSLLACRIPLLAINASDDPIAVDEALPYLEVQQNPYAVLCTTSLGGHLAWFEAGGSRWFPKPVTEFLQKMAKEIDLDGTSKAASGGPVAATQGPTFQPMHRKWYVHEKTE
ncbi:hydrolase, alpha/beta fold family [Aulographum hederae CBS 113979]|uniref:alcohol O-acetyltransferase n=1 Tax=Aulographum hederae CBS 113979 TaxID=1176131 RepID=A0A6G1HA88_9PEZI|nr:hydrolase, alpha/beta fold family [Aulographum hederae CBS 113979]